MKSKQVALADPVEAVIQSQIAAGRYKDISAALNDAAWHHFIGTDSPFAEYGVTPAEVEASARKDLERIRQDRRAGKLVEL
jgi:hypothetical protein